MKRGSGQRQGAGESTTPLLTVPLICACRDSCSFRNRCLHASPHKYVATCFGNNVCCTVGTGIERHDVLCVLAEEKMDSRLIDILTEHLIRDEGLRLKPYRCTAGKLTIGVGRNLDDKGLSIEEKKYLGIHPGEMPWRKVEDGITYAEAMYLLINDIFEVERQARTLPWYGGLCDARKLAVLNLIFNLGFKKFLTFKITIGHLAAGRWDNAAAALEKSLWYKQVGDRAKRVVRLIKEGTV